MIISTSSLNQILGQISSFGQSFLMVEISNVFFVIVVIVVVDNVESRGVILLIGGAWNVVIMIWNGRAIACGNEIIIMICGLAAAGGGWWCAIAVDAESEEDAGYWLHGYLSVI